MTRPNPEDLHDSYAPGMFERPIDERGGYRIVDAPPTRERMAADAPALARSAFAAEYGASQPSVDEARETMRRALQASIDLRQ